MRSDSYTSLFEITLEWYASFGGSTELSVVLGSTGNTVLIDIAGKAVVGAGIAVISCYVFNESSGADAKACESCWGKTIAGYAN